MKIKVALLVGTNGKASAQLLQHVDWGMLADDLMDYDEVTHKGTDPTATFRYIIEAEVPDPTEASITIAGAAKSVTSNAE